VGNYLAKLMTEKIQENIQFIPWDTAVFGIDTFEITDLTRESFAEAVNRPGMYTVKVDPLYSKELLHQFGFYFCDTLVEPYCAAENFNHLEDDCVSISKDIDLEKMETLSKGVWLYDRYHRDFNINPHQADQRYINWLRQLVKEGRVLTLKYKDETAGFFAALDNKVVLHALSAQFSGKGLAKFLWSKACKDIFDQGHKEITSSISLVNIPALHVYVTLGFRIRNPKDVYHCLVKPAQAQTIH